MSTKFLTLANHQYIKLRQIKQVCEAHETRTPVENAYIQLYDDFIRALNECDRNNPRLSWL